MWARVAIILGVVLALVIALALVVVLGQRRIMYYPDTHPVASAADLFPGGRDVVFTTEDGVRLEAWFVPASTAPDSPGPALGEERDTLVLYFPGNGGNRAGRADLARAMTDRGLDVVMVDYRGYGGNPGTPTEDGLRADAHAAYGWVRDHGYAPADVLVVGESLGTGVATRLAADESLDGNPPGGLVLRSPFTGMNDMARVVARGLPVDFLIRDTYATIETIEDVDCPVVVFAGGADDLVPAEQSARVAETAPHLLAHEEYPAVGHNDPLWFGPEFASRVAEVADQL